jgi:hypothetical protein
VLLEGFRQTVVTWTTGNNVFALRLGFARDRAIENADPKLSNLSTLRAVRNEAGV